jgi:hypothetical protein
LDDVDLGRIFRLIHLLPESTPPTVESNTNSNNNPNNHNGNSNNGGNAVVTGQAQLFAAVFQYVSDIGQSMVKYLGAGAVVKVRNTLSIE